MFMGVLYEGDENNRISMHVCAPYGTYELELEILDGAKPASGEIGWEIYQGLCEVRVEHAVIWSTW